MNNTENDKKSVHQGKNAKRLREAKGIKQEEIAMELEISQQAVSQLEKRQELDDEIIAVYTRVLGIDESFIRNMVDDSLFSFFSHLGRHIKMFTSTSILNHIIQNVASNHEQVPKTI